MKILLRHGNRENWKLVQSFSYGDEKELQKLLAESPDLIPAKDMREGASQLVAVVREYSVPIGSIDLLGFTAEGEIAVIECKLANNPEIKRKVIGQVLEYGASLWGMRYEEFDQRIQDKTGETLADLVHSEVDESEWDEELFRSNIEDNLEQGNFILVIVVDEINDQLTRIIRFLNACGDPKFSFAALEMRRFQTDDIDILLPKVGGDYRPATSRGTSERKRWDKTSLFEDAKEKLDSIAFHMLEDLFDFCVEHSHDGVKFGTGIEKGSFSYYIKKEDSQTSIFSVFSNGILQINFHYMAKLFNEQQIQEFRELLDQKTSFKDVMNQKKLLYPIKLGDEIEDIKEIEIFKQCVLSLDSVL